MMQCLTFVSWSSSVCRATCVSATAAAACRATIEAAASAAASAVVSRSIAKACVLVSSSTAESQTVHEVRNNVTNQSHLRSPQHVFASIRLRLLHASARILFNIYLQSPAINLSSSSAPHRRFSLCCNCCSTSLAVASVFFT